MINVVDKICKKESKTFYVQKLFFLENRAFCEITWNNTVEPGRPQMTIWRTRIACWIRTSTNTYSDYVIFIVFHCGNCSTNASQSNVIRTMPTFFNELFPTTLVKQRQHVDAVGCQHAFSRLMAFKGRDPVRSKIVIDNKIIAQLNSFQ